MIDEFSVARPETPAAIEARLAAATSHSHLGDFVLGAVDGAVTTFAAFIVAGFIPLLPYCLPLGLARQGTFGVSVAATVVAFLSIGFAKGHVVRRFKLLSALETVVIGGIAAGLAFFVGLLFRVNGG